MSNPASKLRELTRMMSAPGANRLPAPLRAEHLGTFRAENPDAGPALDAWLIAEIDRKQKGLEKASEKQEELRGIVEKMMVPPWHAATFICRLGDGDQPMALVHGQGGMDVVFPSPENPPDLAAIRPGDQVYLNAERNLLLASAASDIPCSGALGSFESVTPEGRLVVEFRGERMLLDPSDSLRREDLKPGHWIRYIPGVPVAFEAIEPPVQTQHLIGEVPDVPRDRVGGQDANLEELTTALTAGLVNPALAARFGMGGRVSALLHGPPGTGKTLLVRCAVTAVMQTGGRECRLAIVKPGEWENKYVGATQEAIRATFDSINRLAEKGLVCLYLDEVESIGRVRGGGIQTHSDKFLAALLTELDGFDERGNVAVLASTNRPDLIDPALESRLNDIEIFVGRPDMAGAAAIFGIHLEAGLPYSPNGSEASTTRAELIQRAVSGLYAPNADADIATVKLRDGKSREVRARDLISGRLIEQTCRAAKRSALRRALNGGEHGLRTEDIDKAVAESIAKMRSTLTIHNIEHHITDLPQDVGVAAVEPVRRHVRDRSRYRQHQVSPTA